MAKKGGFKESDFQEGIFVPFLTSTPSRGLVWIKGDPMRMSLKDRERWICSEDLSYFLKEGSQGNANSFQELMTQYSNEAELLEDFISQALMPKLASSANASRVLRESIGFKGHQFKLWNEAPKVGMTEQLKSDFSRNRGRLFTELSFERSFPLVGSKFNRRPDASFFVNGIYLGMAELKTAQTGQTAEKNGRKKIAHNFVELATMALREGRAQWKATSAAAWPGYGSDRLPATIRNKIDQDCALYLKACHVTAIDMGSLFITMDFEWAVQEIDRILAGKTEITELSRFPEQVASKMARAPEIAGFSPFDALAEHMESLYSLSDGVDREAFYFHQTWTPNASNEQTEPLKPRPAQRIMLHRTVKRVRELYDNESKPKICEADIRSEVLTALPGLPETELERIVDDSLVHKNGATSHSILLQGAAGLGKTYLIVWLAQAIYEMADPKGHGYQPLFDLIILLTDRTELRHNIAKDAAALGSTKKIVEEAEDFASLRSAVNGSSRIVVVNIQKFASLSRLAGEDATLGALLKSKRVAVLIDEVHRSQGGKLHDATLELFEEWDALATSDGKRNLIVGLTATPKDEALARFGEWRRPLAPGDSNRWVPFSAYSMAEAIRDKVVLNPIQNVLRFADELEFDLAATQAAVESRGLDASAIRAPNSDSVYENLSRQALVAKKIANIFASTTMMAIRRRGLVVGEGKAMVACSSIKAAISMQDLIKKALIELAADPAFKDRSEHLLATPVLIIYSDKQGEMPCASLNGGRGQAAILDTFRRKGIEAEREESGKVKCRNAIIVVVDMLLTGFDEKTLHTLFIDRNLDDVALFQAACRINRVHKRKADCLIVDFSRDGTVSKNLPEVFKKYGGLTVSSLDALSLRDKMDAAWKAFFCDQEISKHWRQWKATLAGGKESTGAVNLSNWLDTLVSTDLSRAMLLKKAASAWVGSRSRLGGILDFDKPGLEKHKDKRQVEFAEQVVRHIASKAEIAKEQVEAVFDVVQVEEIESIEFDVHGETGADENQEQSKGDPKFSGLLSVADIESSIEIMDVLRALEMGESMKSEAIEALKNFVEGMFREIEICGERPDRIGNNGFYKKALKQWNLGQTDFPWDERLFEFKKLFNKAKSSAKFVGNAFANVAIPALAKRLEILMDDFDRFLLSSATSRDPAKLPKPASLPINQSMPVAEIDALLTEHRDENGNGVL